MSNWEEISEQISKKIVLIGRKDVLDIPGLGIETARKIVNLYVDSLYNRVDPQNIIFELGVS